PRRRTGRLGAPARRADGHHDRGARRMHLEHAALVHACDDLVASLVDVGAELAGRTVQVRITADGRLQRVAPRARGVRRTAIGVVSVVTTDLAIAAGAVVTGNLLRTAV